MDGYREEDMEVIVMLFFVLIVNNSTAWPDPSRIVKMKEWGIIYHPKKPKPP